MPNTNQFDFLTAIGGHNARVGAVGIMKDVSQFGVWSTNTEKMSEDEQYAAIAIQASLTLRSIAEVYGFDPSKLLHSTLASLEAAPIQLAIV